VLVVEQVTVIGAAERLAEPGRGIHAGSQEPVGQAGLAQVAYSVQPLTDSDGDRRRVRLACQLGEFPDELVSPGILRTAQKNGRPAISGPPSRSLVRK
jgi:hypothetical protein